MQRMGGGKQKGGGNDPSCGCDMQAGWPSASELPRGGLQGGGNWNFNEFNLALTKNGKTRHLKGKWNTNNNGMRPSMNTNNSNMNNHSNNDNNMNNKNKNKTKTRKTNNKNKNKNNNKTTNRPMTSPPPPLENLMYEGKLYQTNRSTGDTYENGEYVGKYVRPNSGRPYLETSAAGPSTPNYAPKTPNYAPPNSPPPRENNYENTNEGSSEEYDTEEVNSSKPAKTLSMNGGSMPVCGSCPFPGTGACDFYAKGGKRNRKQRGGGCGCSAGLLKGGYRPTRKNLSALKKWRKGQSIGFTMTASLKAKGLIPRTSRKQKGKKVVSRKYR